MKTRASHFFLSLLLLLSLTSNSNAQTRADLILTNGKIFTADTAHLYVQALAIKGNKIVAVGNTKDIERLATAKTKRINLDGQTVVPGFNDAHDHLGWMAPVGAWYHYTETSVPGPTLAAVIDSVSRLTKTVLPGQWIVGFIGTTVLNHPSIKNILDSIAPNNPVFLRVWWGHGEVANSKAFEIVGIKDSSPDPIGGWYGRMQGTNKLSGAIYEHAQMPFVQAWCLSEPQKLIEGLRAYAQEQLQFGITTQQNMNAMLDADATSRIFKEANLPLRIRLVAWPFSSPTGLDIAAWKRIPHSPSPLTYVSGLKVMVDGTPFEQTAFMKTPYGNNTNWYGRLDIPMDTLRSIFKQAFSDNTQVMMHIVGDSALHAVLSLMKQIGTDADWQSRRVRLEHNSTIYATPEELKQMKEMGMLMMHTPIYEHRSPLRSHLADNRKVGISPDGVMNPFLNIMIMTTQMDNPKENITREEAVIAYTKTNAYAEFTDNEKGTLMPGKLADLAVLSQDIFTIPAGQLPATRSILTMVDGKIVFKR